MAAQKLADPNQQPTPTHLPRARAPTATQEHAAPTTPIHPPTHLAHQLLPLLPLVQAPGREVRVRLHALPPLPARPCALPTRAKLLPTMGRAGGGPQPPPTPTAAPGARAPAQEGQAVGAARPFAARPPIATATPIATALPLAIAVAVVARAALMLKPGRQARPRGGARLC